MKKVLLKNLHPKKRTISVGGVMITYNAEREVAQEKVGKAWIDKGYVKIVTCEVTEKTVDPVALCIEKIKANQTLLGTDAFTTAGIPHVTALEAIAGVDMNAEQRDAVWAEIEDLFEEGE